MFVFRGHSFSIMIAVAIVLHIWWALMLSLSDSALNATGMHAVHQVITSRPMLIGTLAGVAIAALAGLIIRHPWAWLLLLPQQIILMMSAAGAIEAIWLAQFADGVLRSRAFIAVDQIYSVLAACGHTIAIIAYGIRTSR